MVFCFGAPLVVRVMAQVLWSQVRVSVRPAARSRLSFPSLILALLVLSVLPAAAYAQDNGSAEHEFHGNGVEINVTVHDGSGEPLAVAAMVKVFRDGTIPSGQAETSR